MSNPISPMLISLVALILPVVLVPVILGIRYARAEREMEHSERLKALELGRTLPQDETWWSPALICVVIGAGVPVSVFLFAWLASASVGYRDDIWRAAGTVGTTAVVCGSVLAARFFTQRSPAEDRHAAKPPIDADAFDVVGRRG